MVEILHKSNWKVSRERLLLSQSGATQVREEGGGERKGGEEGEKGKGGGGEGGNPSWHHSAVSSTLMPQITGNILINLRLHHRALQRSSFLPPSIISPPPSSLHPLLPHHSLLLADLA